MRVKGSGSTADTTGERFPMADTHHHLWDLSRFRYEWLSGDGDPSAASLLGDYASIRVDYLIESALEDFASAGIVRSVHVQADMSEPDPVTETAWLQDIGDRHGFPHAIVAYARLRADDVEGQIDRHLAFSRMRGVRLPETEGLALDGALRRGLAALEARGLSLQVDAPYPRMSELVDLATAYPRLAVVLGHTGLPEERTPAYVAAWRAGMRRIAACDNVVVKISGLGMGDHGWTTASIQPFVREAIDAFGVERCMFGTNWPVDRLYSDLPTLADAYRSIIADVGAAERRQLLLDNAERFYRMSA